MINSNATLRAYVDLKSPLCYNCTKPLIKNSLRASARTQGENISKFTRINEQIRANELRVLDEHGANLGVMSRIEALAAARAAELDLVEVSPDANPPVCKIVDYGKYNYQREKQLQKNKRNVKVQEVKQMRFGLKIGENDMTVKLRKVQSFLDNGDKVKIAVVYRGRENAHRELGFKLAERLIDSFNGTIAVDSKPQLNGKQLIFMIRGTGAKPIPKAEVSEDIKPTYSI